MKDKIDNTGLKCLDGKYSYFMVKYECMLKVL